MKHKQSWDINPILRLSVGPSEWIFMSGIRRQNFQKKEVCPKFFFFAKSSASYTKMCRICSILFHISFSPCINLLINYRTHPKMCKHAKSYIVLLWYKVHYRVALRRRVEDCVFFYEIQLNIIDVGKLMRNRYETLTFMMNVLLCLLFIFHALHVLCDSCDLKHSVRFKKTLCRAVSSRSISLFSRFSLVW